MTETEQISNLTEKDTPARTAIRKVQFKPAKDEDYESLVNSNFPEIFPDNIIKGNIIKIDKDFVTIDIGYKSYGRIAYSEFLSLDGTFNYDVNDQVELYLEYLENQSGQVVLSKQKANRLKVWENVSHICENDGTIEGCITAKIKGGLAVDIGIKAFLPGSQIELRPVKDIDEFIGKKFEFKILKHDVKRNNVVLSRRALLEVDREDQRKELLNNIKEGAELTGHVKNITDYGLFIDLGGVDGLLHITDMTWGRIDHPSELYQVGDEIGVVVLGYDEETKKISLGLKQKHEDPWLQIQKTYQVGKKVTGKVVNLTRYGAFLELEDGVEGLLHISEMSWTEKIRTPTSILQLNDEIEAVIKEIDFDRKRISLSIKDLQENPWKEIAERFPIGSEIKGTIRNVTEFGIFVEIEPGVDGLVHASDVSWRPRQKNKLSEQFKKDQEIVVKLLSIDVEKGRLSLGLKQMTDNPWKDIDKELHTGDEVQGKVMHVADFGIFIELKEGLEGLIHFSEVGRHATKKQLMEKFPLNSTIPIKILKIDASEKRLALQPIFNDKSEAIIEPININTVISKSKVQDTKQDQKTDVTETKAEEETPADEDSLKTDVTDAKVEEETPTDEASLKTADADDKESSKDAATNVDDKVVDAKADAKEDAEVSAEENSEQKSAAKD